jgi:hypothetical protein
MLHYFQARLYVLLHATTRWGKRDGRFYPQAAAPNECPCRRYHSVKRNKNLHSTKWFGSTRSA